MAGRKRLASTLMREVETERGESRVLGSGRGVVVAFVEGEVLCLSNR